MDENPDFEACVMSPLRVSFGYKRPLCSQTDQTVSANAAYRAVCSQIHLRCLAQEFVAAKVLPLKEKFTMPKPNRPFDPTKLVRLPYKSKPFGEYTSPGTAWREAVEKAVVSMLGNFTNLEMKNMAQAFSKRGKLRPNRVFDSLGVEYPDYEKPTSSKLTGTKRRGKETANEDAGEEAKRIKTTVKKVLRKTVQSGPKENAPEDL